jgi:two-component system, NtrC family, response regulator AtoC
MKTAAGNILIVDDDPDVQEVLKDRLESLGYRAVPALTGKQGLELLDKESPQLVFLDIELPDMNGLEALKAIRKRQNDVAVVIITAYGTIERAVQAMKDGAYDFISKPLKPGYVALIVERAMERERLKREVEILSGEAGERYHLVVAKSSRMNMAVDSAKMAATAKSTVLLLGESGTGKELFARAIHNWSERKSGPFIAVNCVGLSKELFESELFGHEKGAFTGAHQLKKGKMELAHGGTVFLDEIGDISTEIQTKLLRFLQEKEFERVGSTKPIQVDVRIIAATNRNLESLVKEGRFRDDLYYRLNVVPIALPALRERKEDIPVLVDYFLQRFSKETKKNFTEVTSEAMEKLMSYDWPGNARELANTIERAIVLGRGPQITLQDLSPVIASKAPDALVDDLPYREALDIYRQRIIARALSRTQGNRAAAAKLLGMERRHLLRLMKCFGIQ